MYNFKINKYYKSLSLLLCCIFTNLTTATIPCLNVESGYTNLMRAIATKESPSSIALLIAKGEDVNECNMEFLRWLKPVLRYALDRGTDKESVEIIRMLIDAGADVNKITYNRVEDKRVYGMMPLLTYAAIYSSAEIVQILIDAGAKDIQAEDSPISFKKTALTIAQELGKMDIAKILQ